MTHRSPARAASALLLVAAVVGLAACSGTGSTPTEAPPSGTAAACSATPEPASDAVSAWAGEQDPSFYPQIINPSGTVACGDNRLMFSFLDASNTPVASPDRTVEVALYDLGANTDEPAVTADAEFIWAIEDAVGVYVANVELPSSGLWGAELRTTMGGQDETVRVPFDVQPTTTIVRVGDMAPSVDTPTLADVDGDVTKISTDSEPVDAFYETSVADALAAHEPFVLAFATPKFCASKQCGPTLDRLKPIAAAHPDVTFINVEPYQLEEVDGQLQPVLTGEPPALTPAESTDAWRLPTEPWVYVVDRNGIVTGSYMLIFSDEELDAAVTAVE